MGKDIFNKDIQILGSLELSNTSVSAGNFLTLDALKIVSQRTPLQVLNDIGAAPVIHTHVEADILDLKPYLLAETDPVFSAWLATPPNVSVFVNDGVYLTEAVYDPAGIAEQLVGLTASQTVLNKNLSNTGYINFDITYIPTGLEPAGTLYWNEADETIDLVRNGTVLQLGQELYARARNITGVLIPDGSVVYSSGHTGIFPDISLAQGNSEATGDVMGITTEAIADNAFGAVTTFGYVRGLKTNYVGAGVWGTTWAENDRLWLSKDVPGGLTNVEPSAPHHSDEVAVVGVVHPTQGTILVGINRHKRFDQLADVNGTALTTNGQLLVWDNDNQFHDFTHNINDYFLTADTKPFKETVSTGIVSGGELSINGVDNTKFDVAAGVGYIVDITTYPATVTEVTWGAFTSQTLPNLATSFATDIAIDINGNIVQQNSFSDVERRNLIFLGGFDHSNQINILSAFSIQVPIASPANSIQELARAVGDINLFGNAYNANGVNLSIDKSGGTVFSYGRNTFNAKTDPHKITTATQVVVSFGYVFNDGAGNGSFTTPVTSINPDNYDDGTGVLASVPVNNWSIQRILFFPNDDKTFVQYGTANYNKKEDALNAVPRAVFESLSGIRTAMVRGYLIVKQGETNLSSSDTTFLSADRFGTVAGLDGGSSLVSWGNITGTLSDQTDLLNALTHTGEVTGTYALTLDATAISNKTLDVALTGTEEVLINDGGLKKTTTQAIADLGGAEYEILVSDGLGTSVQAALDSAEAQAGVPVRITADIIALDYPILMDSNQTLIFEGYTINVANDVSGGGTDPFAYWNGHAVIKNRNGAGTGGAPGGEWSGTGLGGETNITVIGGTIDGTNQDPLYVYNAVQLHDITDCKVINVKANNVLQRASVPTGNFDTRNSTNIKFINCTSINTDKTGLWANDTTDLLVQGGYFYLSGDSGIAGETNIRPVIDGVLVDNAGRLPSPDGASNITMDLRGGKVINCTSINASGTVNGYGLTIGHPDPFFAYNTVVSNNHFEGNAVNGIRVQGLSTKGITIDGNTFINNGNAVVDGGAGGININQATSVTVSNNYFQNNRHGVITSNGATNNIISNNVIEDSNQFGINLGSSGNFIKNNTLKGNLVVQIYDGGTDNLQVGNTQADGAAYVSDIHETFTVKKTLPLDTDLMTGSLLKLQPASPGTNSAVIGSSSGISMQVDGRAGLYGMTASTYVDTARDDFTYKIKAHKGTEAGVELLSLTDDGDLTANNLSGTNTGDQILPTIENWLRSDIDDTTNVGIRTWFGGAIAGQDGSGARIQVNGFQRTGNIYLHAGGNTPNSTRVADFLSNSDIGDLQWTKNLGVAGKVWHSENDGEGSTLDADLWHTKTKPEGFAETTTPYTTIANLGWDQPIGTSIFSKSDSVGGVGSVGYWFTTGRRDVSGGYSGILTSYNGSSSYIGSAATSSENPTWHKIWTNANFAVGGTSNDFVKGDGSLDSTEYATTTLVGSAEEEEINFAGGEATWVLSATPSILFPHRLYAGTTSGGGLILLDEGVDYTISGATITYLSPVLPIDEDEKHIIHYNLPQAPSGYSDPNSEVKIRNADMYDVINTNAYYKDGAVADLRNLQMMVVTDIHGDVTITQNAITMMNEFSTIDGGMNLGDTCTNTWLDDFTFVDPLMSIGKPFLIAIGNHDEGLGYTIANTGSTAASYTRFVQPYEASIAGTHAGKSYYYKDWNDYNIRMIMLYEYDDNDDVDLGDPLLYRVAKTTRVWSQAQIDWLISTLEGTPAGYSVVIGMHQIVQDQMTWVSGIFTDINGIAIGDSSTSIDEAIIPDIVNAYINGTTIVGGSYAFSGDASYKTNLTVDADFTIRGAGEFICYMAGHAHVDVIATVPAYPDQTQLVLTCSSSDAQRNRYGDVQRQVGKRSEDCINVVSFDTVNKQIKIARIGAQITFDMRKRDFIAIDY